ncbi:MAG: hypothetical protein ACRCY2_02695, partial [Bombilactobacillus sp.]
MSDLKANRLALASIWGILNLKEFSKFYLYRITLKIKTSCQSIMIGSLFFTVSQHIHNTNCC